MSVPPEAFLRPQRRDAQRNRERILRAAAEAFAADGADAQMDHVARRAGVGVGTVYRHFPTKEELMAELVRRKFAGIKAAAEAALEADDAWEGFAGMLHGGAAMMAEDAALRDALMRVPAAWDAVADERAEVEALGARVIARAQEAGRLRADFTVADLPVIMCGITSAMSMPGLPEGSWKRHLGMMLDGLRAR